jgi:hypothetical protein
MPRLKILFLFSRLLEMAESARVRRAGYPRRGLRSGPSRALPY